MTRNKNRVRTYADSGRKAQVTVVPVPTPYGFNNRYTNRKNVPRYKKHG